jgi:hypothetical protein
VDDLARLVDAAFDFLCERRVNELVDVQRVLSALDALPVERLVARLVAPARTRVFARLAASDRLLGVWLPEPVKDALAQLLGTPVKIPRDWIDRAVADERVRDQVRQAMQDALSSAVEKGFAVTPGGRGLRGVMGLASAAGRGILGGFADELETRLKGIVDSGVAILQQRAAQKLASEETAVALGKRRRRAFKQLMKTPEKEAARTLGQAPHEMFDALTPSVWTHNLARAEFREALREEIAAAVTELSKQTIGELLDELGLRAIVKEGARAHALPLLEAFVASAHFKRPT